MLRDLRYAQFGLAGKGALFWMLVQTLPQAFSYCTNAVQLKLCKGGSELSCPKVGLLTIGTEEGNELIMTLMKCSRKSMEQLSINRIN